MAKNGDTALRRGLCTAGLWISGVLGLARLVEFVARFMSVLVRPDANPGADPFASFAQVVVTVAIAGGLFWWVWELQHQGERRA